MDEFYSHYYYDGENKSPEEGGADVCRLLIEKELRLFVDSHDSLFRFV
jgi:hypothetical protein